jgi:hypothetical protein
MAYTIPHCCSLTCCPPHLACRYYSDVWVRQQDEQELWSTALRDLPSGLRIEVVTELLRGAFDRLQVGAGRALPCQGAGMHMPAFGACLAARQSLACCMAGLLVVFLACSGLQ